MKKMFKLVAIAVFSVSMVGLTGCSSPAGPRYQNVGSFSEGLAAVQVGTGRWGFINQHKVMVIPARFQDAKDFKDGKAAVKLNGRWGFINKRGEWL